MAYGRNNANVVADDDYGNIQAALDAATSPSGSNPFVTQSTLPMLNAKKDYGAVGDGVTDDTVALQAFITAVITGQRRGVIPAGDYLISDTLDFSYRPGWSIEGEARDATTIVQDTDNVPILNLGSDTVSYMHSFSLTDMTLTYTDVQSSSNTSANCILISQMPYQGVFDRLFFRRGYFGFKVASGIGCPWGSTFDNLWFNSEMTGGAMDWSVGVNGVPNNHFGRLFCDCSNMVGPVFSLRGYNFVIDTIEFIGANQGAQLISLAATGKVQIGALKLENGVYASSKTIFDFLLNSYVQIGHVSVGGSVAMSVGAGATVYLIAHGAGGTSTYGGLRVGAVDADLTANAGSPYLFSLNGGSWAEVDSVVMSDGWELVNNGSAATPNRLVVNRYLNHHMSDPRGDANYTVALGDPNIVEFDTALTAQRTISLPSDGDALHNGLYYRFIFDDGVINGANTVLVKVGATTIATVATNKSIVEFTYRRNPVAPSTVSGGWRMTMNGLLP